jgi:urease accessory protein
MLMRHVETAEELQRVAARGRLSVRKRSGRTRLAELYQEGAAKIRMPATSADPLEAVLINTAGGLTGGDRIAWEVEIGQNASASLTTQACEKVYRSAGGHAETNCVMTVGAGARLAWLPQETIVFDRAAFRRRIDIDLADGAEALVVEATIFGRRAMGEAVDQAEFRDRWRVRHEGKLVHAEDFAIGPDVAAMLARSAVGGGSVALATVLLVSGQASMHLDAVRAAIGERGGASSWQVAGSGKLLARLYDEDGYSLRKRLMPLIGLLNGKAGLPKLWSL